MLAYPGMIVDIAKHAGMEVPSEPDGKWDFQEFLKFAVLCELTLGRGLNWSGARDAIGRNAEIIQAISMDELKTLTLEQVKGKLVDLL